MLLSCSLVACMQIRAKEILLIRSPHKVEQLTKSSQLSRVSARTYIQPDEEEAEGVGEG